MKKLMLSGAVLFLCLSCGHTDPALKYPNMVADLDPFSLGTVNASLDKMFSSDVKGTVVEVIFYPRTNEVALNFNQSPAEYWQFWNEPGRQRFIEALDGYKDDFDNQRLVTKYSKSRAVYGKVKGRSEWKTLKFSSTYRSSPSIELGYRFRDGAPYFSVCQNRAKEESKSNKSILESNLFSIYFTRAQGAELAKLFDKVFLLESIAGKARPPSIDSSRDVYIRQ